MNSQNPGKPPCLDEIQLEAVSAFTSGKSVALLGGVGSGKSHVLCRLIAEAEKLYGKFPHVAACALTNKAANALQGVTIHSLFGAKPSWEFSKHFLWEGIKSKPKLLERLSRIKVLIIDELSLLRSNEIDAIDHVFRQLSTTDVHASVPFGGRIVIVAGDPFQLEPYEDGSCVQVEAKDTSFQSRAWYLTFGPLGEGAVVILRQNHRQSQDPEFFQLLNRIRTGTHSGEDLSLLNSTSRNQEFPPETHVRLFPTNAQVADINKDILMRIPGDTVTFTARDEYFIKRYSGLEARLNSVAPKDVEIKVGARVILTRKMGDIPPGTRGMIERILNYTRTIKYPRYLVDISIASPEGKQMNRKILRVGATTFDIHGYDREVIISRTVTAHTRLRYDNA